MDVGDNSSQYTQASIDTIAEFKVLQSGFNAECGRNSGMVIAVQTKSGSSQFHGTAYEVFSICNTLQPQLRYNQFGGDVSEWIPIPKLSTKTNKKMFFFYNREMTRRDLPGSSYADVPNPAVLAGNFTPWLLATNMQYAPAFKNGTVFEPGTVTRDGAGNITGGTPIRTTRLQYPHGWRKARRCLRFIARSPVPRVCRPRPIKGRCGISLIIRTIY